MSVHSCGPHCERVPCLKRRIAELEGELSAANTINEARLQKIAELEAKLDRVRGLPEKWLVGNAVDTDELQSALGDEE